MRLFRFDELRKLTVLAGAILVFASLANAQRNDDDGSPTPPGLYITPTALSHAVQQDLNPGLTNYPNFVAIFRQLIRRGPAATEHYRACKD